MLGNAKIAKLKPFLQDKREALQKEYKISFYRHQKSNEKLKTTKKTIQNMRKMITNRILIIKFLSKK